MKIGLFGGTFDPVHNGHIAVARQVKETLALDEIRFIPALEPPHKLAAPLSSFDLRVAMLELAIAPHAGLVVSRIEERLPVPSYTIDTLAAIRNQLPAHAGLFFLIGVDAFLEIGTWKKFQLLPAAARLVVLARPPHDIAAAEELIRRLYIGYRYDAAADAWRPPAYQGEGGITLLRTDPQDVSSSEIRHRVKKGQPFTNLVTTEVAEYITRHGLYGPGS